MGNFSCSCISKYSTHDRYITEPLKLPSISELEPEEFLSNPINIIQRQFRTFLCKKKASELSSPEILFSRLTLPEVEYSETSLLFPFESSQLTTIIPSPEKSKEKLTLRGPIKLTSHEIYMGEWNSSLLRHGCGIQYWTNGCRYFGNWSEDKACGSGKLYYSDGDYYEGEWLNNSAHGYGEYIQNSGAFYKGEWENDQKHGKGVEEWANGDRYEGDFYRGRMEGVGVFEWASGEKYEGEFWRDLMEGKGVYVWKNGKMYEGFWRNNKMHGEGRIVYPNKSEFSGCFVKGKKHGKGVFENSEGEKIEQKWDNGKKFLNRNLFSLGQSDEKSEFLVYSEF